MKLLRSSGRNDNQTFKSSQARSNWSRMPFHFNIFMKCLRGFSVDEDEDQAELNDRIRTWIQNSSSVDNQPIGIAKSSLEDREAGPTMQKPQHQVQPQQFISKQSNPEPGIQIESKHSVEPLNIVESVVAMVIAPLNHLPQIVDHQDQNPLLEFQSKLAKIVPDSIENFRFHTQNLMAWKESLENREH